MTASLMTRTGLVESAARMSLSPATWGVFSALSIISVSMRAALRDLHGSSAVVYVLLSVVIVPIVVGVVGAVTAAAPMRTRLWVPVAVATWITAGLGRILVETILAAAWELPQQLDWHVYAGQLVAVPLWAGSLGLIRAMNVQLMDVLTHQDRLIARLQMTAAERWDELAAERAVLASHVSERIKPEVNRISVLLASAEPSGLNVELSEELQQVAERSRELVRRASGETTELADRRRRLDADLGIVSNATFAGFLPAMRSTTAWSASPLAVGIALALTMLSVALVGGSVAWGLTGSVLVLSVIVNGVAWRLMGRVLASLPEMAAWVAVIAVNIASPLVAFTIFTGVLSRVVGLTFVPRLPVVAGSFLVLGGIVITFAQIWARERAELLRNVTRVEALKRDLEALDADTQLEYERACVQAARLLHGPIQGRLAAVVMSLQFGARDARGITPETLASCRALVDACLADLEVLLRIDTNAQPLESTLRELRRRWSGLVEVRWTVEPVAARRIEASSPLRAQVEDLIGDCVTNASRHGSARHIHFTVEADASEGVVIRADDDGTGPALPLVRGTGLRSLGELGVDWSIAAGANGGCRVQARLPLGGSAQFAPATR